MKVAAAALLILHLSGATAVHAQAGSRPALSVPAQFHGRWAKDQRACRPQHFTNVITIKAGGWSGFEEGGKVTRVGQIRRGTHYFRVSNWAGEEKTTGSLAVRREGPRIVMTLDGDRTQPVHYSLIRCG